ncbi:MAG: hypothetical protein R3B97_02445 [Dehalococcoidia bacterium]|nr:hypothetical protein [Dehalococcoidia bacterium]MCB9485200.1 hypothetical protein [Thermoflexaceae bacterium]
MHRLKHFDWEAGVVIVVAVTALVLHLLHLVEVELVLTISMVALATILIRDLAREGREDRLAESVERIRNSVEHLQSATAPGAVLVGPQDLRAASEAFGRGAAGDMIWFNVCLLMFKPQVLFDLLLRPAIENADVHSIQFVLDERERDRWRDDVIPKVAKCQGAAKVLEPRWCDLHETVSFILGKSRIHGGMEGQLSFWGEPFMAETGGGSVPRYVFHLPSQSPLIGHLLEMDRRYRMAGKA